MTKLEIAGGPPNFSCDYIFGGFLLSYDTSWQAAPILSFLPCQYFCGQISRFAGRVKDNSMYIKPVK